jgi:2-polyprenyl-3-methyl-5-hydroxy-6-metoxy-1,4-benzoquinol methylase
MNGKHFLKRGMTILTLLDRLTGQKAVCPWWLCCTFDNPVRKLFHDPYAILAPYVHSGDSVIDIGCGMGYFTIPLAKLAGKEGHVTAIDIQEKMLAPLRKRAERYGVSETVTAHLGNSGSIGCHEKADFILLFWMFHEVPDQRALLIEVRDLLKPEGLVLFVEPIIHVPKKSFLQMTRIATEVGFTLKQGPQIRFSRSALLSVVVNDLQ